MHLEAQKFTIFAKSILPDFFINKKVLDVGGGDINGNNRFLFENCNYECNDVANAPNVTIISFTKDLQFENEYFDTIISTECFEHDPEYTESIKKIYNMLKKDGLFVFTCASEGRPEHGTSRTTIHDSYGTIYNIENMKDYYKNINPSDIYNIFNVDELFSSFNFYYNYKSKDLYFIGIKRGNLNIQLNDYKNICPDCI